jgi:DNA-binding XRE family transcriptional regulator
MGGMIGDGEQGEFGGKQCPRHYREVKMTSRRRDQGALGRRLESLRRRASLSRRDLDRLTGVSEHTIQNLEQGRADNPRLRTLLALAGGLGVSLPALLEGLPPDPPC